MLGLLIILFSGFKYLFTQGVNDNLYLGLVIVGVIFFLLSIILPSSLSKIEFLLRAITQHIGKFIFLVILFFAYVLLVLPVGIGLKIFNGTQPFYFWTGKFKSIDMVGWIQKEVKLYDEEVKSDHPKTFILYQPIKVISFFVRHKNYAFIPLIAFMLILGLIMFFVKSSSLAPFIYTLF